MTTEPLQALRQEPREIEIRGDAILCDGAVVARFEPGAEGFLRRRFEDWLNDGGNPREIESNRQFAFDEGKKEGLDEGHEVPDEAALEEAKAEGLDEGRKEALTLAKYVARDCLSKAAAIGFARLLTTAAVGKKEWQLSS